MRKRRKVIFNRINVGKLGFPFDTNICFVLLIGLSHWYLKSLISRLYIWFASIFLSMSHNFGFLSFSKLKTGFLFFIQPAQEKLHNVLSLIYKFKCMYTLYTLPVLQYHVHNPYPYHYQKDARKMVKLRSNRKKTKKI